MKTLLLLAGRSERFWPLGEKMLIRICGKTLLEHQIDRLQSAGLGDITLVVGPHNRESIGSVYPSLPAVEQEDMEGGTRAALLSALPECGHGPVLIICGNDIVEPAAYKAVVEAASTNGTQGALLAQRRDRYFPGGYLTLAGDRIESIVEKPREGNEPSNLVNIEIHAHNNASILLEALRATDGTRDDGYEQALASLFNTYNYTAVPHNGFWQAVKYPWHVLQILPHLLGGIGGQMINPSADVHPSAIVEGNVILGEGVRVFPHATVRGPCYIGSNSIVGNNALVREASVARDCIIGFSTEVKSSVFLDHIWTHSSYIGDSVIGTNVAFGAGCVTGNLRLDEASIKSRVREDRVDSQLKKFGAVIGDNTRLGIQVGINPGVKVGGRSFIAGGAFITQDVPDGSFVRMKEGALLVSPNREKVESAEGREDFRRMLR